MADRSCAVILHDGCILMVRQTYRGRVIWTFPGGSVEAGETPMAAAVREAAEETCLTVEVIKSIYQAPRTSGDGVYYCFLARLVEGEAQLGYDPEDAPDAQQLHEVRWLPLSEVREHPEVVRIWDSLPH